MSVALFDEMVSVCKENGVLFTVHQQRRWDKDYRIMKEVYDKNGRRHVCDQISVIRI